MPRVACKRTRGKGDVSTSLCPARRLREQESKLARLSIQDHPVSRRGARKRLPIRIEALKQESGSYNETQGCEAEPRRQKSCPPTALSKPSIKLIPHSPTVNQANG